MKGKLLKITFGIGLIIFALNGIVLMENQKNTAKAKTIEFNLQSSSTSNEIYAGNSSHIIKLNSTLDIQKVTNNASAKRINISSDYIYAGSKSGIYKLDKELNLQDKNTSVDISDIAVSEKYLFAISEENNNLHKFYKENFTWIDKINVNAEYERTLAINRSDNTLIYGTGSNLVKSDYNFNQINSFGLKYSYSTVGSVEIFENHVYFSESNGEFRKINYNGFTQDNSNSYGYATLHFAYNDNKNLINIWESPTGKTIYTLNSDLSQNKSLSYGNVEHMEFYEQNTYIANSSGLQKIDIYNKNIKNKFTKSSMQAISVSSVSKTDSSTIEDNISRKLQLRISPYMSYNGSQKYKITFDDGTPENVTANATVTSDNSSVIKVYQSNFTLKATNNENISKRITIRATYTNNSETYYSNKSVTVASLTLDNVGILSPLYSTIAVIGNSYIQYIIFVIIAGIGVTLVINEFAGIGMMLLMVIFGWVAGWLNLGIMISSLFFAMFIFLNSEIDTNEIR